MGPGDSRAGLPYSTGGGRAGGGARAGGPPRLSADMVPQVRGSASGAGALIEVEVRHAFEFGRIVCGRLVEVEAGIGVEGEIVLRRSAGREEGRRGGGQAEVGEDGVDGLGGGDEPERSGGRRRQGEDAHVGAAAGTGEGEDLVDAGEEAGPAGAGGGALWGVGQVGACRGRGGGRRRQLEGREGEDGAAVARGARREVDDLVDSGLAVWCGAGAFLGPLAMALDTQALQREGRPGTVSEQALAPGGIGAIDAEEASRLKPPPACQVSMSSTLALVSRPRRWKRRSTRRCSVRSRRRMSWAVRCVASWKLALPSSPSEKTPSRMTTWKWKWGFRAEPKRCRKETAPTWASPGAAGLARRSVVRMPRSRTRSTSPTRRGSWGRKGRIRFGREKTHWRSGSGGRT
jgi:hypothetical protein